LLQQRFQFFNLGKRGNNRFFNHDSCDGSGQRLFKHIEMMQRSGGDKQGIKRCCKKFSERCTACHTSGLFCGLHVKSHTAQGITVKFTQCGQVCRFNDCAKPNKP